MNRKEKVAVKLVEEEIETSKVPRMKQNSATMVKLSLVRLIGVAKTMEKVKETMKAATTIQISIVGTTMRTVMAADMIQKTVETIKDPVITLLPEIRLIKLNKRPLNTLYS